MPTYEKAPFVPVSGSPELCVAGWPEIAAELRAALPGGRARLVVECYPGVRVEKLAEQLRRELRSLLVIDSERAFRRPQRYGRVFKER